MSSLIERAREAAKKQAEGKRNTGSLYNKSWNAGDVELVKVTPSTAENPRTQLRVVPYTMKDPRNNPDQNEVGSQWYKRRYWVHRVGADNVRVLCNHRTLGKPCVVCAERRRLQQEGANDDVLKRYNSSERELFNVWDMADKKLKLLDASTFTFGKKLLREINDPENEDAFMFLSPDKDGKYLSCRFDASSLPDVTVLGSVKFVDAKVAIPQEVLDKAIDLDSILTELPDAEIEALMAVTVSYKDRGKAAAAAKVADAKPADTKPAGAKTVSDLDDLDF
jgi:hypothetical protein